MNPKPEKIDFYKVLGVSPDATVEQIRTSYRNKQREFHPDRLQSLSQGLRDMAEEHSRLLNLAYETLANSKLRKHYDSDGWASTGGGGQQGKKAKPRNSAQSNPTKQRPSQSSKRDEVGTHSSGSAAKQSRVLLLWALVAVAAVAAVTAVYVQFDRAGTSPELEEELRASANGGDLARVEELLADGVDPNAKDAELHTALMWASFEGHAPVVRVLLKAGADVEPADVNARTALFFAASGPHTEVLGLLLSKGATVDALDVEGWTPLMIAAAEGQITNVQALLAAGADPAVRDGDGDSAETFARTNGHMKVVEILETASSAE